MLASRALSKRGIGKLKKSPSNKKEDERMTWTKVTDALPHDGEAAPAEDEEDLL